jgi:nucleotide-binding universal stress UspA family protein
MAQRPATATMGSNVEPKGGAMFRNIIWATDGSANADDALPFVRALAESTNVRIFAVHCTEVFVSGRATGLTVAADEDELQGKIRSQVDELRAEGLTAKLLLVEGAPSETARLLAKAARTVDGDVIVTATRGHGLVTGAIVGSVTQRLLHLAPCPVLAVPPARRLARRRKPEAATLSG